MVVAVSEPAVDLTTTGLWLFDAATGTRRALLADLTLLGRPAPGPGGRWVYVTLPGDRALAAVDATAVRPVTRCRSATRPRTSQRPPTAAPSTRWAARR